MNLSLIICTRNRAKQLGPCLDAVTAMEKPEGFELVLVDNASDDETPAVLENYAAKAGFPVKYVTEPVPGLGKARNTGWRAASGKWVCFTDDDCYVDPQFANALLGRIDAKDGFGFFGGRILLHDPSDLPITILTRTTERHFPAGAFVYPSWIQGANFGMRRDAIERAGGFDERLGAGTPFPSEDIEMVGRLAAMGESGNYFPDVTVRHHHGRKTKAESRALYSGYERGAGAYYALMLRQKGMKARTITAFLRRAIRRLPHRTLNELLAIRDFVKKYPQD